MQAPDVPRLALRDALADGCSDFDRLLRCHGFCVLTGLPEHFHAGSAACDHEAERLLEAHLQSAQQHHSLQIPERSTRLRHGCSQSLPLVGVGVNTVRDAKRILRAQFHLLADAAALRLVPWPMRRQPALRPAVEQYCGELHRLAAALLSSLGGGNGGTSGGSLAGSSSDRKSSDRKRSDRESSAGHPSERRDRFGARLERERSGQVGEHGDPSVFDMFLYPNRDAEALDQGSGVNMRAHTDPGLLTLTMCSATPGLQCLDRSTGSWVDVEASPACEAGCDCIVFCGEALQVSSGGVYAASLHRVRTAPRPRVSTVFELRITQVPRNLPLPPPLAVCNGSLELALPAGHGGMVMEMGSSQGQQAGVEEEEKEEEDQDSLAQRADGYAYCLEFVRSRLAHGSDTEAVLREFNVSDAAWPRPTTELSDVALAEFIFEWVAACKEREAAAQRFAAAEFVTITPAFADSTGRYVDVHFS